MITDKKHSGFTAIKEIVNDYIFKMRDYPLNYFDNIIDIGANIGAFSIFGAILHPQSKIFAYEPCKETYGYLVENTCGFRNIKCLPLGLGDGTDLYLSKRDDHTQNMFVENETNEYKIKTIKLSDIIKDMDSNYMIKIDAEGAEKFLIKNDDAFDVISNCSHFSMEVHFIGKSERGKRAPGFFLEWKAYNDWISQFKPTHDIDYYSSNKHRGAGHYLLKKKKQKKIAIKYANKTKDKTKNKIALITVAGGGSHYKFWAKTLYYSLRDIGKFKDDIYILTDTASFFDDIDHSLTNIIKIKKDQKHEYNHIRFEVFEYFDVDQYDYIIYCDSDIVCVNNISPILSFANENLKNKIGYVRESLLQTARYYFPAFEIEKKESLCQGKEGINAGFFICDASLFKKYMEIWRDSHKYFCSKNEKFINSNQSVFNYLIETEVFNSQELPKYYVEFPEYYLKKNIISEYEKRINETNILYHIVGTHDRNVHGRMKYYYRQELKKANLPDRIL